MSSLAIWYGVASITTRTPGIGSPAATRVTKNETFKDKGSRKRPGMARTPNPDSSTETTIAATISANPRNLRRTAQHDTGQMETDTGGRRGPDF